MGAEQKRRSSRKKYLKLRKNPTWGSVVLFFFASVICCDHKYIIIAELIPETQDIKQYTVCIVCKSITQYHPSVYAENIFFGKSLPRRDRLY